MLQPMFFVSLEHPKIPFSFAAEQVLTTKQLSIADILFTLVR